MKHPVRRLTALCALGGLALPGGVALAQTPPPAAASGVAESAVSDRAKRDAAGPLYWIRLNAQKADAVAKPAPRIVETRPTAPAAAAAVPRSTPPAAAPTPAVATAAGTAEPSLGTLAAPGPVSVAGGGSDSPAADQLPLLPPAVAPAVGEVAVSLAAPAAASRSTETARPAAPAPAPAVVDDAPLALVSGGEPEFPAIVVRKLRKGTVQVRFEVQLDGRVANASVVQTTSRSLNDAALEAVRSWRFQPVRAPRSAVVDLGFDLDG